MVENGYPMLARGTHDRRENFRFKKKRGGAKKKPLNRGIETLTEKQKRVMEGKMEGLSTTAAVQRAYGYHGGPLVKAANALLARKPIIDALESKGVTDEKIAEKIADGLEAEKTVVIGKGEYITEPDHSARVQYLKEANRVRDNYPAIKVEKEEKVVHISLTGDDVRAIEQFHGMRKAEVVDGEVVPEPAAAESSHAD